MNEDDNNPNNNIPSLTSNKDAVSDDKENTQSDKGEFISSELVDDQIGWIEVKQKRKKKASSPQSFQELKSVDKGKSIMLNAARDRRMDQKSQKKKKREREEFRNPHILEKFSSSIKLRLGTTS